MDKIAGVIGLGIMGGAMAANLAKAGWQVHGYDPEPARRDEARAAGVLAEDSLAEVIAAAPVMITSLPSPKALLATAEAIAAQNPGRRTVVETSTFALPDKLAAAAVLNAAGHIPLDCPLSGTGAQARVKDLVVYASGDSAELARIAPLFADFSRALHDVGAFGNGSKLKFIANLLVAIHNVASAEAMLLGVRSGLDPHQLVKLIGGGAGTSVVFGLRAPLMADERYEPPTMKVSTWQKDMAVIGDFARDVGAATPLFDRTAPIYDTAMEQGMGGMDTAAVFEVLKRMG